MTKAAQMILLFAVTMAGTSAMTLIAVYYPDSPGYISYGVAVLTIAAIFAAVFFMTRKKAT